MTSQQVFHKDSSFTVDDLFDDNEILHGGIKATRDAAIAAYKIRGMKDVEAADKAAVEAMRAALNKMKVVGRVVIGEGERDKAPMLYIGEKFGCGTVLQVDVALDPLECTNACANNKEGSISVLAFGPKGSILHAPDCYMQKIAVGKSIPCEAFDLDWTLEKNIHSISEALYKKPKELTVYVLDRPRHKEMIGTLNNLGVQLKLIEDGDVMASIHTCVQNHQADVYIGIGGAPEGVIAAAGLKCLNGVMKARLIFSTDEQKHRAVDMGCIPGKVYRINEMIKAEVIFVATAITNCDLLKGVIKAGDKYVTHSLILTTEHKGLNYYSSM